MVSWSIVAKTVLFHQLHLMLIDCWFWQHFDSCTHLSVGATNVPCAYALYIDIQCQRTFLIYLRVTSSRLLTSLYTYSDCNNTFQLTTSQHPQQHPTQQHPLLTNILTHSQTNYKTAHHIISYHIISYHIISYHIISYHISTPHDVGLSMQVWSELG